MTIAISSPSSNCQSSWWYKLALQYILTRGPNPPDRHLILLKRKRLAAAAAITAVSWGGKSLTHFTWFSLPLLISLSPETPRFSRMHFYPFPASFIHICSPALAVSLHPLAPCYLAIPHSAFVLAPIQLRHTHSQAHSRKALGLHANCIGCPET
ncbi:Hypothetical predicted protein [Podarcis lilfordi]|uniref:Uncharacterized protein n=1 Tax=Podarcis lilfordi TaxID=74358 RepID=A0AA35KML5_9SAUR|nr:Hypothetical predicted protein [Podarcis lilfordi]